ncbi:hypothetical protein [Arenibacter sp. P308M17]|nr:hypothetical protein [Arenibacter sp. P308M17]
MEYLWSIYGVSMEYLWLIPGQQDICFLLVFMNALHLGDPKNEQNTNLG